MPKLLIIEDEPLLREMYTGVFTEQGINVISAESAEEGLLMIEQEMPDLIVLDILLPNADGNQMLEQLRKNPRTANLKVVAFSNYNDKTAKEKAYQLGVLDYLIKTDYTPREFVEKIKGYLQ
ncbi:response regulator [bacterium (Candidatus Gribaldobacteria) CG08_land_8_20_14_0_20_39_15]|uniref:Response regulator n=1 Tax=bacterium (Candidatus Gribaldobacteria) CG08_land_8_20_14_0_20_39_15 TaxID=2014273 RepID=A0A2M6XUE9_9BACT|nr:MAG: response regulator [bacterium (Candidatus Gribaldobacteria) CG08_land_8_20_14_0_20_39_15]